MTEEILDIGLFNETSAQIGELLRTQDNRITSDPLFVVEKKVVVTGFDSDYADFFQWVDFENDYYEADEEQAKRLDEMLLNEPESIPAGWEKVGCRIHWQFVTCCLTEQGCKDFLKINGHNVGESRIYAYSGWRNYEWQHVRKAFLNGTSVPDK